MDLPKPPQDQDTRNIIDKLAQFVARNGPEFEKMTKTKQKDNPKFSFLFGGEHYNYYLFKVTAEQAILKRTASQGNAAFMAQNRQYVMPQQAGGLGAVQNVAVGPIPGGESGVQSADVAAVDQQIALLKEQIKQSESNLNAQHNVLIQQQQVKVNELVMKAQLDMIFKSADEENINLQELDQLLQPIIETCTKDSISSGKGWILQHATSKAAGNVIAQHLLRKVTLPGAGFTQKLHIIYLVNDVLHHCARKNAEDLKKNLENVVVPMFCNASIAVTEEQETKLNKLLKLWESKSNYFDSGVIEKLKSPTTSYQEYQSSLISQHSNVINVATQHTKSTFENYKSQHQAFVTHTMQQIQQLEMQKAAIQQLKAQEQSEQNNFNTSNSMYNEQYYHNQYEGSNNHMENGDAMQHLPPNINYSMPPPGYQMEPPVFQNGFPDLSKPPPGFPEFIPEDLTPSVPYFDLPAGLMVPLVNLEDHTYKPLDPEQIRLPPPAPPSERLLAAVEAFYSAPNHERPRDNEGWEKLGLYEYYKAKNQAKKQKEDDIANGARQKSRSPTPIPKDLQKQPSPPRRCYKSLSRTPSPHKSPERRRERTPPPSRRSRRRSRSRSPRRSMTPPPRRAPAPSPPPRRRRSPSPRPITPPSFLGASYPTVPHGEIDSSNKGHQMLKKMGWGEGGLGATGQGIQAPISNAPVRDKQDQYKGIGVNLNDPYENFRKNKGAAFITRMKERALERSS